MATSRLHFVFLNIGHFFDHLFMLIFATVALRLSIEWEMSYAELIPYATPGFVAFGLAAIPAGWLADHWSREGMMTVFFIGVGTSSVLAGLASSPLNMVFFLTLIGLFAAIYHPVGLAMVVKGRAKAGVPLAINGIFGNLGVASAALLAGLLVDLSGWRSAFIVPGVLSIAVGFLYWCKVWRESSVIPPVSGESPPVQQAEEIPKAVLYRVFGIVLLTSALGGLIFQSTTFSLPKVLEERLSDLEGNMTLIGSYAFVVFTVAAFAQLVVGYLVDRFRVRIVFACVALIQSLLFFAMTQLEGVAALLVAGAFMLMVFGQVPINDVLIGRIARSHWRSRAYAIRYIVSFSVMALTLPLISWLHGTWGFDALFRILSVTALGIFLAVLFLPSRGKALAWC